VSPPTAVVLVKLGGSLITDKTRPMSPRLEVIDRLARETHQAMDSAPGLRLVLGHGSGSFGHTVGQQHNTRAGVRTPEEWVGFARVSAAAAQLNRLVADAFVAAGVPVLSLQPSASAVCRDGILVHLALEPILAALDRGLVPLVYGDVALDRVQGGTIISTEEILAYLTVHLRPERILLLGEVEGVLDSRGRTLEQIRPGDLPALSDILAGSRGADVTGGMLSKVADMLRLVESRPGVSVRIFSGLAPGALRQALIDPGFRAGTLLSA